jgi:hypothetical protein
MKVSVERIVDGTITSLISLATGATLTDRYAEMMQFCQKLSGEVWSGYIDDKLVCCWGLIPPSVFSDTAYLWMYNTESLAEHQFVFVRRSQIEVERMLTRYGRIVGHCVTENVKAQRWLRWLGAEFDAPLNGARAFTIRKRQHG